MSTFYGLDHGIGHFRPPKKIVEAIRCPIPLVFNHFSPGRRAYRVADPMIEARFTMQKINLSRMALLMTEVSVIKKILYHLKLAVDPPPIVRRRKKGD